MKSSSTTGVPHCDGVFGDADVDAADDALAEGEVTFEASDVEAAGVAGVAGVLGKQLVTPHRDVVGEDAELGAELVGTEVAAKLSAMNAPTNAKRPL